MLGSYAQSGEGLNLGTIGAIGLASATTAVLLVLSVKDVLTTTSDLEALHPPPVALAPALVGAGRAPGLVLAGSF